MADLTLRDANTIQSQSANTLTPATLTVSNGDLVICWAFTRVSGTVPDITTAGFTLLEQQTSGQGAALGWRIADGDDGDYAIGFAGYDECMVTVASYNPAGDTIDTENIQSTLAYVGAATATTGSITANEGDLLFTGFGYDGDAGILADPDGSPTGTLVGSDYDDISGGCYAQESVSAGAITDTIVRDGAAVGHSAMAMTAGVIAAGGLSIPKAMNYYAQSN